jgi:hypothetical protein
VRAKLTQGSCLTRGAWKNTGTETRNTDAAKTNLRWLHLRKPKTELRVGLAGGSGVAVEVQGDKIGLNKGFFKKLNLTSSYLRYHKEYPPQGHFGSD